MTNPATLRDADPDGPTDVPRPQWTGVAKRVFERVRSGEIGIVCAGVAFYLFLAVFPALAAVVMLFGVVFDPAEIRGLIEDTAVLPADVRGIFESQLETVTTSSEQGVALGFVVALTLALLAAGKGTKALIQALNLAYLEDEDRGFLRLNATVFLLSLGAASFGALAVALVVALPAVLNFVAWGIPGRMAAAVAPWPVLIGGMLFGLGTLYAIGPSRERPRWQWLTPGAIAATLLWIAASIGFSMYVSNFGSYDATYGSLGAVVVMLTWLLLTAYVTTLGALINVEVERAALATTSTAPPRKRPAVELEDGPSLVIRAPQTSPPPPDEVDGGGAMRD